MRKLAFIKEGKTGCLVPPRSSHMLSLAIIRFFKEKMGETFKENIKKEKYKYGWDGMVDVIENLVQSMDGKQIGAAIRYGDQ